MQSAETLARWLTQGAQKRAIARATRKPMLISEIYRQAQQEAPRIRLKHVRPVLEKMIERGLLQRLTEDHETGTVYAYTDQGADAYHIAFAGRVSPPPKEVDWELLCLVARGKTRNAVLREVGTPFLDGTFGKTATQIRKHLRESYPLSLNPVIETIKFLRLSGLIEVIDHTPKRSLPKYSITIKGSKLLEILSA